MSAQREREIRTLRGNEPLPIDGQMAWRIRSGSVALFAVWSDDGIEGSRRYLFTLNAGETILWLPLPKAGLTVLAVAIEEASLIETSLESIADSARAGDPASQQSILDWAQHLEAGNLAGNAEEILRALETLQSDFASSIERAARLEEEQARRRFAERQRSNAQLARQTVAELASITGKTDEPVAWDEGALLATARRVGQAQGLTIREPQGTPTASDPLDSLLEASQARRRNVLLAGRWWTTDGGPLLAFRTESRTPVALIPSRRSMFAPMRYRLYEGALPGVTVTEAIAHSLDPVATAFYTPLPDKASTLDLLRFAFRGRRRECMVAIVAAVGSTLLGMLTPQASLILFEYAVPAADRLLLFHLGIGLAAAAAGALLLDLARAFSIIRLETCAATTLQSGLWDRLLKQGPSFFRRFSSGDLSARVDTISQVHASLGENTISSIFVSLLSLLNLALMFYYNVPLALAALAIGVVAVTVSFSSGYLMLRLVRPLQEQEGHLFGMMVQIVNAVPKLQTAGAEQRAFAQWGRAYGSKQRLKQELQALSDRVRLFGLIIPPVSAAVLFWLAYGRSELTLGVFIAFNSAFVMFLGAATSLADSSTILLYAGSLWKRMRPILDSEPEVDLRKSNPGQLRGGIAIEHVTFRYQTDGPLTLDDVSIRANPGECVAIVGPSGCGKSTVVNMLLKFESPSHGAVYYDGHDLSGLDVHAVRRQLGVVSQENKILPGTIYENIVCGSLRTLNEAWEAARSSGLAADIEQMPMGMHTMVSEGGGNISGGQRQRLLIARALVQKPRILILDEATSALDNRTQAIVTQSLDNLKVTRVIVAHRLSTIRGANRIYVMERGRVIQEGTFAELLQQEGLFRRLMKRQMA